MQNKLIKKKKTQTQTLTILRFLHYFILFVCLIFSARELGKLPQRDLITQLEKASLSHTNIALLWTIIFVVEAPLMATGRLAANWC